MQYGELEETYCNNPGGPHQAGEKWSDCGHILKVEPTCFADMKNSSSYRYDMFKSHLNRFRQSKFYNGYVLKLLSEGSKMHNHL